MKLPSSSALMTNMLQSSVADMRQRMSAVSTEAVTGRRSDLTLHLEGRIGKAMLSSKALDDLNLSRSHLDVRETRLDIAQSQLSIMNSTTSALGADLSNAIGRGDELSLGYAAKDAESALSQIFASLNVKVGDRYLFSGDATASRPLGSPDQVVEDIRLLAQTAPDEATFITGVATYFFDPAGTWQQTIYQGSDTASDPDAIIAIDPAITQLVSGLAVAALAGADPTTPYIAANDTALLQASQRILDSQAGVIGLRGELGLKQEEIALQRTRLDAEETILTSAFNGLTARDQFEAAAELQLLETNLEAAYILTSRLSDLTLLNYLR